MRETFEFRVVNKFVSLLFGPDDGKALGTVRLITLSQDDPRLAKVGEIDRAIHMESGEFFFHGWDIYRKYSKAELCDAKLLHLENVSVFEPSGAECGTQYDESAGCPRCGTGARQVSDLRLDLRKVPKSKHIARTLSHEYVVSQHLAEKMIDAGLTGFELRPVRHKAKYDDDPIDLGKVPTGREILRLAELAGAPHPTGRFSVWINRSENRELFAKAVQENAAMLAEKDKRRGKPLPVWHQLVVTSTNAEIVPPTLVGLRPFDYDDKGEYRCALGDLIGLNLLSEVSIIAASRGDTDVVCSRQYIGVRRGVLRPRRLMFISQKFRRLLESEKVRGTRVEIVHLV